MRTDKFWITILVFGFLMTMLPFFGGESPLSQQTQINQTPKEAESFDEELSHEDPLVGCVYLKAFIHV